MYWNITLFPQKCNYHLLITKPVRGNNLAWLQPITSASGRLAEECPRKVNLGYSETIFSKSQRFSNQNWESKTDFRLTFEWWFCLFWRVWGWSGGKRVSRSFGWLWISSRSCLVLQHAEFWGVCDHTQLIYSLSRLTHRSEVVSTCLPWLNTFWCRHISPQRRHQHAGECTPDSPASESVNGLGFLDCGERRRAQHLAWESKTVVSVYNIESPTEEEGGASGIDPSCSMWLTGYPELPLTQHRPDGHNVADLLLHKSTQDSIWHYRVTVRNGENCTLSNWRRSAGQSLAWTWNESWCQWEENKRRAKNK